MPNSYTIDKISFFVDYLKNEWTTGAEFSHEVCLLSFIHVIYKEKLKNSL